MKPPTITTAVWVVQHKGKLYEWSIFLQEWMLYHGPPPDPNRILPVRAIRADIDEARRRRRVSPVIKEQVKCRDGYRCVWCHTTQNLTMDHKVPFSQGGPDTPANLQTLCSQCNTEKGDGPNVITPGALARRRGHDRNAEWVAQAKKHDTEQAEARGQARREAIANATWVEKVREDRESQFARTRIRVAQSEPPILQGDQEPLGVRAG